MTVSPTARLIIIPVLSMDAGERTLVTNLSLPFLACFTAGQCLTTMHRSQQRGHSPAAGRRARAARAPTLTAHSQA